MHRLIRHSYWNLTMLLRWGMSDSWLALSFHLGFYVLLNSFIILILSNTRVLGRARSLRFSQWLTLCRLIWSYCGWWLLKALCGLGWNIIVFIFIPLIILIIILLIIIGVLDYVFGGLWFRITIVGLYWVKYACPRLLLSFLNVLLHSDL